MEQQSLTTIILGIAIPVVLFEIGLTAFLYYAGKLLQHEEDMWGDPGNADGH